MSCVVYLEKMMPYLRFRLDRNVKMMCKIAGADLTSYVGIIVKYRDPLK